MLRQGEIHSEALKDSGKNRLGGEAPKSTKLSAADHGT